MSDRAAISEGAAVSDRGSPPTPEELAAVVTVLVAVLARAGRETTRPTTSAWADPSLGRRGSGPLARRLTPSPHAWRTSFWPR